MVIQEKCKVTNMVNLRVLFSYAAKVDLDNELVRHFLIETTKKGVRLKGYNDEPVFGKFWLNTAHLFDEIFTANCSLLTHTPLFERAYEGRSILRVTEPESNVGMDF